MSQTIAKPSSSRLFAVLLFIGLPVVLAALTVLNMLQIADDSVIASGKEQQVFLMNKRLTAPAADGKPVDLSSIYVTGTSRTLASADLQRQIVNSISAATGRLIETVTVDVDDTEKIQLKVTLDIDNDGLLSLLYGLESGLPLIDVETLSVRMLSGSAEGGTETLRVEMTVSARWKSERT